MQVDLDGAPTRGVWRTALIGLLLLLLVTLSSALWRSWQALGTFGIEGTSPAAGEGLLAFRPLLEVPILALAGDETGAWLGAAEGLYRYDAASGAVSQVLPVAGDPLPLNVHALYATEGVLYLGFTRLPVVMDSDGQYAFQPVEDPKASEGRAGIAVYTPTTGHIELLQTGTPAWGFAARRGEIYANTDAGVVNVHTGEHLGPPSEALGFVLHGTPEALYAGMQDGIWRWDGSTWSQVLATNMQKVLGFGELDGQLYAAINEQGLYASADGLAWELVAAEPSVQVLALDETRGRLYLGGQGLWVYHADTQTLEHREEIRAEIRGVFSQAGTLYLGTNRAAYRQVVPEEVGQ